MLPLLNSNFQATFWRFKLHPKGHNLHHSQPMIHLPHLRNNCSDSSSNLSDPMFLYLLHFSSKLWKFTSVFQPHEDWKNPILVSLCSKFLDFIMLISMVITSTDQNSTFHHMCWGIRISFYSYFLFFSCHVSFKQFWFIVC